MTTMTSVMMLALALLVLAAYVHLGRSRARVMQYHHVTTPQAFMNARSEA